MVIENLNFLGVAASPAKDDTPLIIDPDGIVSGQLSFQRFKPVARRYLQITQFPRIMQIQELASCRSPEFHGEATYVPGGSVVEEVFGKPVAKGFDHVLMLSEVDNFGIGGWNAFGTKSRDPPLCGYDQHSSMGMEQMALHRVLQDRQRDAFNMESRAQATAA